SLLGFNEIAVLVLGGVTGMLWRSRAGPLAALAWMSASATGSAAAAAGGAGAAGATVSLAKLGLFFLKVGAVLYGSGYVLVAFLEGGLVRDYGWLTEAQLMDAIAIGQLTPGPVLSTATFVGYVLAGVPGAALATAGIFLPSFLFVAALSLVLPRLRRSRWMAAFFDAVNMSSVALMAAVTVKLSVATLTNWPAWAIALAAAAAGLRWKLNATWLVLAGAVIGRVLWAWT
ncbi:MAG: chromate transporter, partial [candidate division NC10 bacterium]|nr:chromate transporter [candidate division NC10 bacterium]